ncbi:MAG TPA: hypothetical protein VLB27_03345, partial [candidate division Zixibacteria bacterium]|nr:hypothetical protein [candidate division Zixibacteria bacterium]
MKHPRHILGAIAAALTLCGSFATAVADDNAGAKPMDTTVAVAPLSVPQTHCPVMGGPIDSGAYTDIQGQRVYHCCPMCTADLRKDPDKFFMKSAAAGILFENIQTTCPVTGDTLSEKTLFTDYHGRRIYVATAEALKAFNAAPETFLARMDGVAEEAETDADDESMKI